MLKTLMFLFLGAFEFFAVGHVISDNLGDNLTIAICLCSGVFFFIQAYDQKEQL